MKLTTNGGALSSGIKRGLIERWLTKNAKQLNTSKNAIKPFDCMRLFG